MPAQRCHFCTARPYQEVAVTKWRGEDRERLTVWLCIKHYQRLAKPGPRGWEHQGYFWKTGFW